MFNKTKTFLIVASVLFILAILFFLLAFIWPYSVVTTNSTDGWGMAILGMFAVVGLYFGLPILFACFITFIIAIILYLIHRKKNTPLSGNDKDTSD